MKSHPANVWTGLFGYDDKSGSLLWLKNKPKRKAGDKAGNVNHSGKYITLHVTVSGVKKRYLAHRIVWEMHNGQIPDGMCIDHIDGNGLNNKLSNLRVTTLSGNQRNSRIPKNNSTGIVGVYPKKNGWCVQTAGKYTGYFSDFFDACCARKSAERKLGFHENHGRKAA